MRITVPARERDRDQQIGNHLRKAYPRSNINEDTFPSNLAKARQYAQQLGFTSDQHILDVVECCFLLGSTVYTNEVFQDIVARSIWHNEEKCQALRTYVIAPHIQDQF